MKLGTRRRDCQHTVETRRLIISSTNNRFLSWCHDRSPGSNELGSNPWSNLFGTLDAWKGDDGARFRRRVHGLSRRLREVRAFAHLRATTYIKS